ncbi:hypothetical protein FE257_000239 [Aspergillus nanangensis]|uniref:Carrier domain-containing protein n=1 Tax=Aspergillus nanangensis TaxID=2582783 RepID=A0AAD4CZ09_ASPNN|nr:hypothetical protein FE257_000239 [Aspergillus nanangensis]
MTTAKRTATPGQRLLTTVVDELAASSPHQKLGLIPKQADAPNGFQDVTAKDLAGAVNATACWMEKQIGRPRQPETIAFMGSNDIRYLTMVLASHKLGYKPLLPSPRLSHRAYEHLMVATQCDKFFYTVEKERKAFDIKEFRESTQLFEVPGISDLMNQNEATFDAPPKAYRDAEDEIALIIHSSGTTGMPKPVPLTHGFFATIDFGAYLPSPAGRQSSLFNDLGPDHLVLSSTPFFHLMGFLAFTESIFHNVPFVNLPDQPLSVKLLVDTIKRAKPTAAMLPPSIIEDMSQSEDGVKALGNLDYVYFAGAPLAPETGNRLSGITKIITVLGSSEMGILSSVVPQGAENWMYFEWNPAYGVRMEHMSDGLHELVIPRQETSRAMHGIFHTFPTKTEYRSNDLFVQHPQNPDLWKYHGRLDDVIVLSNGEKLNPVTLEKIIEDHPKVHRAVLVGQNRFQTSLLIEPNWDEHCQSTDRAVFLDEIWPSIETANQAVPNYGRITKSKVRLSSPEKLFKLTPKGTTQRHTVNNDYKDEINAIYSELEEETAEPLPTTTDIDSLTEYVSHTVAALLGREDISHEEDLYSAGLDSLQTIQLSRTLKNAVSFQQPKCQPINAQDIYAHPTIRQLSEFLRDFLTGHTATAVSREERINNMVSKYTSNLPQRTQPQVDLPETSTIILTGSTGSLGTYLLSTLLNSPKVTKVYCFNRSPAQTRQISSFSEKGLNASILTDQSKVEFLQVSFGAPHFGLPYEKYASLLDTVDLVIHNAWAVNFNIPLESFEDPHIQGMHEFITFSIASKFHAHISFVSSVSTIGAWTREMGPRVPEQPFESTDAVMQQGYGESKHVAERICLSASRDRGVATTVFRVGQIAGPTRAQGVWNQNEWLPTLVATSKALGKVPADLGGYDIDWVPVDTLAQIMCELLQGRRGQADTANAFFHLMNPAKTTWQSIVPAVQKAYDIPAVSMKTWLGELEGIQNPSDWDVREKPALKLLDFYRGFTGGDDMLSAEVETANTCQRSPTMAGLGPITAGHMVNWINQWGF